MNAVISSNILRNAKKITEGNKITAANFSVILGGIVSGALVYLTGKEYIIGEICDYFLNFTTDFSYRSKIEVLSGLLLTHIPYVIICVTLGVCIIGTYLIYFFSFIKAAGISIILAHIYCTYKLKGVEYALLVFLPGKFMMIFAMLSLMYISVNCSIKLNKKIKGDNTEKLYFSGYYGRSAVTFMLFVVSSLIDFICVSCFSPLFDFLG